MVHPKPKIPFVNENKTLSRVMRMTVSKTKQIMYKNLKTMQLFRFDFVV